MKTKRLVQGKAGVMDMEFTRQVLSVYPIIKRVIDFILAFVGLIILSPLIIVIIIFSFLTLFKNASCNYCY